MPRDLAWTLESFTVGQEDTEALHSAAVSAAQIAQTIEMSNEDLVLCLDMLGYTPEKHAEYRVTQSSEKKSA